MLVPTHIGGQKQTHDEQDLVGITGQLAQADGEVEVLVQGQEVWKEWTCQPVDDRSSYVMTVSSYMDGVSSRTFVYFADSVNLRNIDVTMSVCCLQEACMLSLPLLPSPRCMNDVLSLAYRPTHHLRYTGCVDWRRCTLEKYDAAPS